ncbi:hypothetical protein C8R47DRAFT_1083043 [Mycena vitilis]|nr:hypothetical protein C8R47DRAFT_1083043 [Mycena vitilis]
MATATASVVGLATKALDHNVLRWHCTGALRESRLSGRSFTATWRPFPPDGRRAARPRAWFTLANPYVAFLVHVMIMSLTGDGLGTSAASCLKVLIPVPFPFGRRQDPIYTFVCLVMAVLISSGEVQSVYPTPFAQP